MWHNVARCSHPTARCPLPAARCPCPPGAFTSLPSLIPTAPPHPHCSSPSTSTHPAAADGDDQPAVRGDDAAARDGAGCCVRRLPALPLHKGAGGAHVPGQRQPGEQGVGKQSYVVFCLSRSSSLFVCSVGCSWLLGVLHACVLGRLLPRAEQCAPPICLLISPLRCPPCPACLTRSWVAR